MSVPTEGQHWIAELSNCRVDLTNGPHIQNTCWNAAEAAEAKVLYTYSHKFDNGAVSIFVMLAESHIAIHTWPEEKYASLDVYTCGKIEALPIVKSIAKDLQAFCFYRGVSRGQIGPEKKATYYNSASNQATGSRFE